MTSPDSGHLAGSGSTGGISSLSAVSGLFGFISHFRIRSASGSLPLDPLQSPRSSSGWPLLIAASTKFAPEHVKGHNKREDVSPHLLGHQFEGHISFVVQARTIRVVTSRATRIIIATRTLSHFQNE